MNTKAIFLCLILSSLFFLSYSQNDYKPGYIVTNNYDTLRGYIVLKSNLQNSTNCEFFMNSREETRKFSPYDLIAIRIDNYKYYISKEIIIDNIKQRVFLEFLVDGIVDLYYLKEFGKEQYFIERDTILIPLSNEGSLLTVRKQNNKGEYEETYFKNSNQYKGILKYLFQDSPVAMKEIDRTAFDYRPLIELTKDYHNSVCKDRKCIDFTKSTSRNLYLEPYFGVFNSWMGLRTSEDLAYDIGPFMGLQLRLKPFKGFSSWNILAGLNYSTNYFNGDFDNNLFSGYLLTYRITTKYSTLRIPLAIEYSLPATRFQPFISIAYKNIILINPEYEINRVDREYPIESYFRKYQYGVSLGLGVRYNLKNTSYLFINNEFEYRKPLINFAWVLDHTNVKSYLINFGYGFKIK